MDRQAHSGQEAEVGDFQEGTHSGLEAAEEPLEEEVEHRHRLHLHLEVWTSACGRTTLTTLPLTSTSGGSKKR